MCEERLKQYELFRRQDLIHLFPNVFYDLEEAVKWRGTTVGVQLFMYLDFFSSDTFWGYFTLKHSVTTLENAFLLY